MDVLDKFFTKYSYKFPKGYPDLKDKQDILLMESILEEEFGFNFIFENAKLESFLNKSNLFSSYGDLQVKEKKLYFSDIPSKGDTSTKLRNEVYNLLQKLADKSEEITDFKKRTSGGSLGSVEFKFNDEKVILGVKGGGDTSNTISTDTDIKEGLVVVFYEEIKDGKTFNAFNIDNLKDQLNLLSDKPINEIAAIPTSGAISLAIGSEVANKVTKWVNKAKKIINDPNPDKKEINKILEALNNAYSIGKELETKYPKSKAIRDSKFETIRQLASKITRLEQDKWNPGDIYLQHRGYKEEALKDAQLQGAIEPINNLFNDKWGETDKPLTSISLKQEDYQPGRAKSYISRFGVNPEFKIDKNIKKEKDLEGLVKDERQKAAGLMGSYGDVTVDWNIKDGKPKGSKITQLQTKLQSLKFFNYLLDSSKKGNPLQHFLGIFAFGEGLDQEGKVNPTFFKLIGKNDGGDATFKKYPRGATVSFNPGSTIKIIDSEGAGSLVLKADLLISKGDESRVESTTKTFRTSGGDSIQLV